MILIKNGHIVDPVTQIDEVMDILIDKGIIIKTGKDINYNDYSDNNPDLQLIDASGLIVAPGLMDAHVHFRDPGFTYKEDIETGATAAAKGGFTTVVCMANTKPVVDNVDTLHYIQEKGEKTGIHILQTATVTLGNEGKSPD